MKRKLTLKEINENIYKKHGNSIIMVEYGGLVVKSKSSFLCNSCGNIWKTTVHAITKPNNTGCPKCAQIKKRKKLNFKFDNVKKYIEENNCILISETYINSEDKLDVIFECGHTGKISFECFKRGQRCRACGILKNASKQRLDQEKILDILKEDGLEFVEFPNGYKNRKSTIIYKCIRMGHVEEHSIASVLNGASCNACRKAETLLITSGSMGNNWLGGISSLTSFLKKKIIPWKKEAMKRCDYKCVICGDKFDDIHHTYNFYNIMIEALKFLGIELENSIRKYTQEQLFNIEKIVLEKHSKYPGICLCRICHDLYHKEYGLLNGTPEKFQEFLFRIQSNEIIISNQGE